VEKLGNFLELEILSKTDAQPVIEKSRSRLLELLEICGISSGKIENRYYSEMLQDKTATSKLCP
jgi:adenylate cyclase class IV